MALTSTAWAASETASGSRRAGARVERTLGAERTFRWQSKLSVGRTIEGSRSGTTCTVVHALARVCILESLDLRSGAHKSHRHSSAARGGGWAWRTASCPLAVRTIPYRARRVLLLVRHTRTPHTNTTVHRVLYSSSLTYRDDDRTSGGVRTCRTCDPMLAMYKVTGARYQGPRTCGARAATADRRGARRRPTPMCAMSDENAKPGTYLSWVM
jgi:hypothetical protein